MFLCESVAAHSINITDRVRIVETEIDVEVAGLVPVSI
jgi:hypothetical protein